MDRQGYVPGIHEGYGLQETFFPSSDLSSDVENVLRGGLGRAEIRKEKSGDGLVELTVFRCVKGVRCKNRTEEGNEVRLNDEISLPLRLSHVDFWFR